MMAQYINNPTVPILYLRPKRAAFDVVGNSIDGGVNGEGQSISVEMSGGGRVSAVYEQCVLQGDDTERHEIINWLGARGNQLDLRFQTLQHQNLIVFIDLDGSRKVGRGRVLDNKQAELEAHLQKAAGRARIQGCGRTFMRQEA